MVVPLAGPVGVGALVDGVLLGCALIQSFVYYKNSRENAWSLKSLVSLILFLLLSHLGCLAAWVWVAASNVNGDASQPAYAAILFGLSSIFGSTVLFFERCFFATRILKTSCNQLVALLFFILCIFSFTAALGASSVFFTNVVSALSPQSSSGWIFPLAMISGLVCDLALSVAMAVCLVKQTPNDSVNTTGTVRRLVFVVAEIGLATSFVDLAAVITFWLTRTNYAWVGLLVAMPGVFANVFLAELNARGHLIADIEHQRTLDPGEQLINKRAKRPPIVITISQQVENYPEKSPVATQRHGVSPSRPGS